MLSVYIVSAIQRFACGRFGCLQNARSDFDILILSTSSSFGHHIDRQPYNTSGQCQEARKRRFQSLVSSRFGGDKLAWTDCNLCVRSRYCHQWWCPFIFGPRRRSTGFLIHATRSLFSLLDHLIGWTISSSFTEPRTNGIASIVSCRGGSRSCLRIGRPSRMDFTTSPGLDGFHCYGGIGATTTSDTGYSKTSDAVFWTAGVAWTRPLWTGCDCCRRQWTRCGGMCRTRLLCHGQYGRRAG